MASRRERRRAARFAGGNVKGASNTESLRDLIARAERLYRRCGLAGGELAELLARYRESIGRTDTLMLRSGVAEACARCAESRKGSCCFREMGESYDLEQLLGNLMLGCALPARAEYPDSCQFVGAKGCKLMAKHSFCLNYFCPDLKKQLGADEIDRIQRQVGEQLLAGWDVERALAALLANADAPG